MCIPFAIDVFYHLPRSTPSSSARSSSYARPKLTQLFSPGSPGVAGVLTIYSAASLVNYNRRQRELWVARQLQSLQDARRAYLDGTASLDQLELLQKEAEADADKMMREELKKQRYTYKARQWLFGGLEGAEKKKKGEEEVKPYADAEGRPTLMEALRAKRIEALEGPFEFHTPPAVVEKPQTGISQEPEKKGWFSWLTGR